MIALHHLVDPGGDFPQRCHASNHESGDGLNARSGQALFARLQVADRAEAQLACRLTNLSLDRQESASELESASARLRRRQLEFEKPTQALACDLPRL